MNVLIMFAGLLLSMINLSSISFASTNEFDLSSDNFGLLKRSAKILIEMDSQESLDKEVLFSRIRSIGFCEYAKLTNQLPINKLPNISELLPRRSPDETQKLFTGNTGAVLLQQSIEFINFFVREFSAYSPVEFSAARIVDYGSGWGRLLRLMFYHFDCKNLYGFDPWDRAIQECFNAGIRDNIFLIDRFGDKLPNIKPVEAVYAFSVFTHLPEKVLLSVLQNISKILCPEGILIITIRPLEYWVLNKNQEMIEQHSRNGYAYKPHGEPINDESLYGDASFEVEWLMSKVGSFFNLKTIDGSLSDPYQIYLTLQKK